MKVRARPAPAAAAVALLLGLAALAAVVELGLARAGPAGSAAVVVTEVDGYLLVREPLPADGAFALTYLHSVYGVGARERFAALPGGGFQMLGVSSPSEAVLDYYGLPGTRRQADGWWHLDLAEPTSHSQLPLVATPRGRRTLEVAGAATALHPAERSRHLVITVERR